jgi:hypothetical protein
MNYTGNAQLQVNCFLIDDFFETHSYIDKNKAHSVILCALALNYVTICPQSLAGGCVSKKDRFAYSSIQYIIQPYLLKSKDP